MKFKTLIILFSICFITMIQSCSNEQEPTINGGSAESEVIISHMVVKFEEKIFETDVKVIGDSVVYLNQEYAEVYNSKISKLPELATVMTTEDEVTYVEYLASKEDVEKKYSLIRIPNTPVELEAIGTRSKVIDMEYQYSSENVLGYAELYDDRNFSDTMLKCNVTDRGASTCAYLKNYGFNDKCSSIKVYNKMRLGHHYELWNGTTYLGSYDASQLRPVLVCFENSDYNIVNNYVYKGKILYCIAPATQAFLTNNPQVHKDSNLRKIGWNDKISSFQWIMVNDFRAFESINGNDPAIPAHPEC